MCRIEGIGLYAIIGQPSPLARLDLPITHLGAARESVHESCCTHLLAVDLIRPLTEARIPVVAVFGNHDYGCWLRIARPHEVIADGWAQDSIGAPGNRLYVNRGIGFSLVPLRINCRPELTLFTLRRANS